MNSFSKFFILCSGADVDTLNRCTKSELNKYSIIGSTVLIPAILSIVTIGYAAWMVSNNLCAVIVACMIWSTIIFIIERAFVANIKPNMFNWAVLLRLAEAIIISFTISEVVLLGIFRDNINQKLSEGLSAKEEIINQKYHEQLNSIEKEISQAKSKVDSKEKDFLNEIDGIVTSGFGTGKRGYGPAAKKKEEAFGNEQGYFENYKQEKTGEATNIIANRDKELEMIRKNHANGLLGQMIALSEIASSCIHVFWATWLLRFLFIVLETLPLIIKLTSDKSDSQYYTLLKKNEELQLQIYEDTKEAQMIVAKMQREYSLELEQLEIQNKKTQLIINSEISHAKMYNEHLQEMIKIYLNYKAEVIQKIEDGALLTQILTKMDSIFNGYIQVQDYLISKSINYHKV